MKATSGIVGIAVNSFICGRCDTVNGLPSMHPSEPINVARPVSFRDQVMGRILEVAHTIVTLPEDGGHPPMVVGCS